MTSGVRESPHVTDLLAYLVQYCQAVSVVAIRMYFPSNATPASARRPNVDLTRQPPLPAAGGSRCSASPRPRSREPCAELRSAHGRLPQPPLFPRLSWVRLAGYYNCTGSVRK